MWMQELSDESDELWVLPALGGTIVRVLRYSATREQKGEPRWRHTRVLLIAPGTKSNGRQRPVGETEKYLFSGSVNKAPCFKTRTCSLEREKWRSKPLGETRTPEDRQTKVRKSSFDECSVMSQRSALKPVLNLVGEPSARVGVSSEKNKVEFCRSTPNRDGNQHQLVVSQETPNEARNGTLDIGMTPGPG